MSTKTSGQSPPLKTRKIGSSCLVGPFGGRHGPWPVTGANKYQRLYPSGHLVLRSGTGTGTLNQLRSMVSFGPEVDSRLVD